MGALESISADVGVASGEQQQLLLTASQLEAAASVHTAVAFEDMPAWALVVFEYCDWHGRQKLMMTSRRWWRNTSSSQAFYRFLASRLAAEHALYIPPSPPTNDTWKSLFLEMYKLRHLWSSDSVVDTDSTAAAASKKDARFKVSVYARFKPTPDDGKKTTAAEDGNDVKEVTLPLHQRLAMIKMSRNLSSNRAALKVLTSEGGWFEAKWSNLSSSNNSSSCGAIADKSDCDSGESLISAAGGDNSPSDKENSTAATSNQSITTAATATTADVDVDVDVITAAVNSQKAVAFEADHKLPKFVRGLCTAADGSSVGIRGRMLQQQQQQQTTTATVAAVGMGSNIIAGVQNIDAMASRVVMVAPDVGLREFSYDGVLSVNASQRSLYDSSARRLVMDFMNGFNSTAIVYGQTGSGKTYSMFGSESTSSTVAATTTTAVATVAADSGSKGIVPRACEEIFRAVQQRQQQLGIISEVSVSYVEVFGDEVSDLLRHGARCGHSKVASQRFVLQGAAEKPVHNMQQLQELLRVGEAQKRRASTAMNDRSTRAHSLFIVTLNQTLPNNNNSNSSNNNNNNNNSSFTMRSRLFLADLGGSEQVKKSQVDAGATREGQTAEFSLGFQLAENMREAVYINLGLLALKKCIEALNNRALYVPYQDSKLTMLLSEGLGGNSKTSVIVCANTDAAHAAETMATLRFGERCALIETAAVRNNATVLASVLRALDERIASLECAIAEKERWELRNEERDDALAEEGTFEKAMGGREVKKVYLLVGAEKERKQLEELLLQRAKFIGSEPLTSSATVAAHNNSSGGKAATAVVGFGREYAELYGLGGKFDESAELSAENSRFEGKVSDAAAVPLAVRGQRFARAGWATGEAMLEEDAQLLQRKAQKAKRNRLAYSGISA